MPGEIRRKGTVFSRQLPLVTGDRYVDKFKTPSTEGPLGQCEAVALILDRWMLQSLWSDVPHTPHFPPPRYTNPDL